MEERLNEWGTVDGELYITVQDESINLECRINYEAKYGYVKGDMCTVMDDEELKHMTEVLRGYITIVFSKMYQDPFGLDYLEQLKKVDISDNLLKELNDGMNWPSRFGVTLDSFSFTSFQMDSATEKLLTDMIKMNSIINSMAHAQKISKEDMLQEAIVEKKAQWNCSCGNVNTGNFCTQCGSTKPVALTCSNCGWTPKKGESLPNFCVECGTRFAGK